MAAPDSGAVAPASLSWCSGTPNSSIGPAALAGAGMRKQLCSHLGIEALSGPQPPAAIPPAPGEGMCCIPAMAQSPQAACPSCTLLRDHKAQRGGGNITEPSAVCPSVCPSLFHPLQLPPCSAINPSVACQALRLCTLHDAPVLCLSPVLLSLTSLSIPWGWDGRSTFPRGRQVPAAGASPHWACVVPEEKPGPSGDWGLLRQPDRALPAG